MDCVPSSGTLSKVIDSGLSSFPLSSSGDLLLLSERIVERRWNYRERRIFISGCEHAESKTLEFDASGVYLRVFIPMVAMDARDAAESRSEVEVHYQTDCHKGSKHASAIRESLHSM